jgi:AcrR family transcriptional regulator
VPRISADRLAARRREILAGARRAFARHGYEGATVRLLEQETGLSRGAIFHHFRDKETLFLECARADAAEMARIVDTEGLVAVMRGLPRRDAGWLGIQLEVSRRLRTDPQFRRRWRRYTGAVTAATRDRLTRSQSNGTVRRDVDVDTLTAFLQLVHDGLVARLASGMPIDHADAVLDIVESAVRQDSPTPAAHRRTSA